MQINSIYNFIIISFIQFASPSMETDCPIECICLSHTQVLCNAGGLTEIPLLKLPATMERLSFTRNSFPIIASDAFTGLRALHTLTLEGNNITFLKPFAFRGLPRLRELTIRHTLLDRVSRFAFAGLHNLTIIDLSHNKIASIEEYAFAGGVNLKAILFNNNPIRKVWANAFSGLNGVERLVLPSGIKELQPNAFNGLENVGILRLAFMDLPSLLPGTFRGLINVRTLSIEDSDLGMVRSGAFDDILNIATLTLINNKIDGIEALRISSRHRVESFSLRGNHFLTIPNADSLCIGVNTLTVWGNHFPCDCHLHDLLDGPLANSSDQFPISNFCISPLELNGVAIVQVPIETIGRCEEPTLRENLEDIRNGASDQLSLFIYMIQFMLLVYR